MAIKGGGGQQEGGSKKKKKRKNKREKVRRVFTCIFPLELLYVPRENNFYSYKAFDSVILISNHLFNLPIVDFYLLFIRNSLY